MEILTENETRNLLRVSRTTFWRWRTEDPDFPRSVGYSPRMLRYLKSDIEAWAKRFNA